MRFYSYLSNHFINCISTGKRCPKGMNLIHGKCLKLISIQANEDKNNRCKGNSMNPDFQVPKYVSYDEEHKEYIHEFLRQKNTQIGNVHHANSPNEYRNFLLCEYDGKIVKTLCCIMNIFCWMSKNIWTFQTMTWLVTLKIDFGNQLT